MKVNKIIQYGLIFMTISGLLVMLSVAFIHDSRIEQQEKRHQFIKDSLEIEYYKQVLDRTYAFDHSKIPSDASDTAVRAAR